LDYWQGNRTPRKDPNARGVIFGLTMGHNIFHLTKSIYEGISYGSRHIIETFKENSFKIDKVVVGGGGIRSYEWLRIMANIIKLPLVVPRYADNCSLIGSCICAAYGAKVYNSLLEASEKMVKINKIINFDKKTSEYDELYLKYLKIYDSIKELF